jgi:hypothetical protein
MLWDPFGAWPAGRRWLWAGLAVWIALFQGPAFVRSLKPETGHGSDFFQEWASARYLLEGRPVYSDLDVAIERYLGHSVEGSSTPKGAPLGSRGLPENRVRIIVEVNAHPPTSILLAVPFALLDYPDAALLWNLVSLALLVPSFWIVARQLDIPVSWWSLFPIVALLLLCNPLRQQVNLGQLNLVLTLLLTGCWAADRTGRWRLAGALLGAATAIKLFPGFLFLYFLARRQWKTVAAGLVSLAVFTALTAVVVGPETYPHYFRDVLPRVERSQSGWGNASLFGLWRKLFDPATELEHIAPLWRSPMLFRALVAVTAVALVAILTPIIWRARTRAECDHAFGLTLVGMLLLSPISWNHYFLMLLVPLAVLWVHLPASGAVRAVFLVILIGLWFDPLILYDAFIPGGHEQGFATPAITLAVLSFQCYTLVALFALGIFEASRGRKPPEGERVSYGG